MSGRTEKKKWKSPLFGCFSYRTPTDQCKWCPFFCPMSVAGTCCAAGKIVTMVEREDPIVCGLGPSGMCCCFVSNALFGPPGWILTGAVLRKRVIDKFNVEEEGNPILNCCCFPCSYFQMFVSLTEWTEEEHVAVSGTSSLENPILK